MKTIKSMVTQGEFVSLIWLNATNSNSQITNNTNIGYLPSRKQNGISHY